MNKKLIGMINFTLIFMNVIMMAFSTKLVYTEIQSLRGEGSESITELIIGINRAEPHSFRRLRDLTTQNGGKIVNKVSIKGDAIAIVVELPSHIVSSVVPMIKATGLARYVEPRTRVEALFVPNDANWTAQWGPKKIEADWAWNYTKGSSDVLVAVVDTGIDYSHPDLTANYAPRGYDWVNMDDAQLTTMDTEATVLVSLPP